MQNQRPQTMRIALAVAIILGVVGWLSVTAVQANKSYYVTIQELNSMGGKAYTRHLRVAGNVVPGSIVHHGVGADFTLVELGRKLPVVYDGSEPVPDTFKDDAQALAIGMYGRDGVFHATEVQAKCASKYAPAKGGAGKAASVQTAAASPAAMQPTR